MNNEISKRRKKLQEQKMEGDMMMKMMQVKEDVKKASTSESLGAVRERERERELYSNEIEEIGAKEFSSNLATAKAGAHIAICAKNAGEVCILHAQEVSRDNAKNRIRERGVTLVALVVTVIVLLILARSNNNSYNWR